MPEPIPSAQGTKQEPTLGRMAVLYRAHSHWDNLDLPVNLLCTSVGHGTKPEYLEKTHEGMGKIS